jgi:hypothetical protein
VSIADGTGISEIAFDGCATMFLADDVLDFAAKESIVLVQQAILAQSLRTPRDELAQERRDRSAHGLR